MENLEMNLKISEILPLIIGIISIIFFVLTHVNFLIFPIIGLAFGIIGIVMTKKASLTKKTNIFTISFILSSMGIIINIIPLLIYITCTTLLATIFNGALKELPELFAN